MATQAIQGLDEVVRRMRKGEKDVIAAAVRGLLKAALAVEARAKALAPIDTSTLMQSIAASPKPVRTADGYLAQITATATAASVSGEKSGDGTAYSEKVHENMEYDGPNVGGTRTQKRGPKTVAKGISTVEPSDGGAGGKYLERPIRNRPETHTRIIVAEVKKVTKP